VKAVYPGSFDPITNGHLDIIERAAKLFNPLIVAVLGNSAKNTLFTVEERIDMIKEATSHIKNIEITSFDGLLVDFMHRENSDIAIRGMRALSDFDYEFQMALTNKGLYDNMETVFLVSKGEFTYISSSLVKEITELGGDVSNMAPENVVKGLWKKLRD